MTDEEIINQWKHERELAECVCSYFVDQVELSLVNETIDLINRQKAEIERLQKETNLVSIQFQDLQERINDIKSEAYKEFAERLKEVSCKLTKCNNGIPISNIIRRVGKNLKRNGVTPMLAVLIFYLMCLLWLHEKQ